MGMSDWTIIYSNPHVPSREKCRFVIDSGSYENIVSIEAVEKLGVNTEAHSKPYKLVWLKEG